VNAIGPLYDNEAGVWCVVNAADIIGPIFSEIVIGYILQPFGYTYFTKVPVCAVFLMSE
jgi:hypothetical protein